MTRLIQVNVARSNASLASQLLQLSGVFGRARSTVGASLLAMVVNDDAFKPGKRGAFECFAGKPAPTVERGVRVGASLLAKVVNDDAFPPGKRRAFK
ncbi:hypothetical protein AEQ67_22225 [Pseudomonas sp. RIT-PI-q]|uniref:hypothetical protein n=1 Tax=Pseudomonas sp. RIT-PI-q TaxID=1690247 RepID=UPI0006CD8541|nr:hypothetical protein [Pseudomonas sp. RIT-PI-q]KPG94865.1 hypothetical protein AEQ67_22225 [Pseudomonas sp. RIT-PI-q]